MTLKLLINGQEQELTMEEARRVYCELSEVFGEKEVAPMPFPVPVIPYPDPTPWTPTEPPWWNQGPYCQPRTNCFSPS